VQVLNFQSWTFFFGIAFLLGLYSLHHLSFVKEPSGTTDRLVLRDLLLERHSDITEYRGAGHIPGIPSQVGDPAAEGPRVGPGRAAGCL